MMGSRNAAVLPVPVSAQPIRSSPRRTTGIACSWIGVGSVYPRDSQLRTCAGASPSSEKFIDSFDLRDLGGIREIALFTKTSLPKCPCDEPVVTEVTEDLER